MAHANPRPAQRLGALLWEDRTDLVVLVVYAVVTAVLALAVPLASQALVNTIAAGVSFQPLVVLTGAVLAGLLFAGLLQVLRSGLVEVMQQRVFARVALRLAESLPRVERRALQEHNGSELMNRFFDVISIQKAWAKLAGDGPGALVEVLIGLGLLAFYGTEFLAFALALVAAGVVVLVLCSFGGLRTKLAESNEKYRVAGWLEEMAECQAALKLTAAPRFALERTDEYVRQYILARRAHFGVLVRHLSVHYLLQAVAIAGVLGLGGWMVIQQQLTLGQLVAAELVLMSVMKAADKLVRLTEAWYDLLTALEKVGVLLDLPVERRGSRTLPESENGAEVRARGVCFGYGDNDVLRDLDLTIAPGEKIVLVGQNGTGKTTLAQLMTGLLVPDRGLVSLDGVDVRDISLDRLHEQATLIWGRNEILDDTVENNIVLGRDHTHGQLQSALAGALVDEHLPWLPQGLQTPLVRGGNNLSRGQWVRVQIARAMLHPPRLLVLDDAFEGVDPRTRSDLFDKLFSGPWTLVCVTHRADTARRGDRALVLQDGRVVESGPPRVLEENPESAYRRVMALNKEHAHA